MNEGEWAAVIRPLTVKEIPLTFPLAVAALASNPRMGTSAFNPRSFAAAVAGVVGKEGVFLGAFRPNGDVVGALLATACNDPLTGVRCAIEHVVAVQREFRGGGIAEALVEEFETWARGQGATFIQQSVCHGGEDRGKMLEGRGYVQWDRHYAKVISNG